MTKKIRTRFPLLKGEKGKNIPKERMQIRNQLLEELRKISNKALLDLQYFQPEVGCLNQCRFCSQEAGTTKWMLSKESLEDLIAAISLRLKESSIELAYGRINHRQGVIFPYFDNDVMSYPYLYDYIRLIKENLKCKVRIATVGYSRHNHELTQMHEKIANEFPDVFAGIRFSFTPYTSGWVSLNGLQTSRDEFEQDFANALSTYFPLMERIGLGKSTACVELRFHPNVQRCGVVDTFLYNHHVIKAGPHLLIRQESGSTSLEVTEIESIHGRDGIYNKQSVPYFWLTDDMMVADTPWEDTVTKILTGDNALKHKYKVVPVHLFSNADGPYYAASADFLPTGEYKAFHIYPKTSSRSVSGYNDAERFLLNAILRHKRERGIARRETFPDATWADVESIVDKLRFLLEEKEQYDVRAALHISQHILPIVESYIRCLKASGLPPDLFFDPRFTIDTGQIVNQGRAKEIFKGLVTKDEEPLTPREATAYGNTSVSTLRGKVWRLAPVPYSVNRVLSASKAGGKNFSSQISGQMSLQQLSEKTLRPYDAKTNEPLPHFVISGLDIISVSQKTNELSYLKPGMKKE